MSLGRRGNVFDALLIICIVMIIGVFAIFTVAFTKTIGDAFNESDSLPPVAKNLTNSVNDQTPWMIDFIVMMLMIGIPLIGMALAFFVDVHPIFFWASFGIILLLLIVAGGISVAWNNLTDNDFFGNAAYNMPMTDFIMSHFVIYALLVVGLLVFGTFIKTRSGGYYG